MVLRLPNARGKYRLRSRWNVVAAFPVRLKPMSAVRSGLPFCCCNAEPVNRRQPDRVVAYNDFYYVVNLMLKLA
jgi:hypothetical protein